MPADTPPPQPDDEAAAGRWVSISEAARALGVSRQAVQRRIRRDTLEVREELAGNRRRLLVLLPPEGAQPHPSLRPQRLRQSQPQRLHHGVAEELARAEGRAAAAEALVDELRRRVDELAAELRREREERRAEASDLRDERDQLLQMLVELQRALAEQRRPLESPRRPWPGLRRWWRRFIEGDG